LCSIGIAAFILGDEDLKMVVYFIEFKENGKLKQGQNFQQLNHL
jgi:hypothetical protein